MDEALQFLANVQWVRVIVTVAATFVCVLLAVHLPGRLLEEHTNQPAARYVWYVASLMLMIVIYACMFGYGLFWDLYSQNPELNNNLPPKAG